MGGPGSSALASLSHSAKAHAAAVLDLRISGTAEKLYLEDPVKARAPLKYRRSDGSLCIKVTDVFVCLVYRAVQAQDIKKTEKFQSTDATKGSQGILQCCHGNGLTGLKQDCLPGS